MTSFPVKQNVSFIFDFASGDNPGDVIQKTFNLQGYPWKLAQILLKECVYYYRDDPANPKDISFIFCDIVENDDQAITAFLPDSDQTALTSYNVKDPLPNDNIVSFQFKRVSGDYQTDLKGVCYLSFEFYYKRDGY